MEASASPHSRHSSVSKVHSFLTSGEARVTREAGGRGKAGLQASVFPSLAVGARQSQVQKAAESRQRHGGKSGEGWWDTREMLIPSKGNQSPSDPAGRKGEPEGNEMENTNKLEIRHRGGGKELECSQAGRQLPKGLVFTERTLDPAGLKHICLESRGAPGRGGPRGGISWPGLLAVLCEVN